ncbi:hypothetical protein FN846DRAFT_904863 [Sphaerosporella brunnea]|uniref:Small ribosomal subunit protein mS38 n=1 Tax=Sphaerosporella brunnea TaxID=1250544 RepID=A0A5J5F3S8_9PEZI|nr:hypothetical protein FN846DRAFT_904863 [Sphaerosporella brunnea]
MLPALARCLGAAAPSSFATKTLRAAYSSSSSSKPSSPADGSRSSPRAALVEQQVATQAPRAAAGKPGSGIPFVPSTDHLHPSDVALSTFFALHRPISIVSHFPPSSTPRAPPRNVESRVVEEGPWAYGVPFRPPPVPQEESEDGQRFYELISVRRQRKLKMKKHKYKKLMKKTRNERRRIERQRS